MRLIEMDEPVFDQSELREAVKIAAITGRAFVRLLVPFERVPIIVATNEEEEPYSERETDP